MGKSASLTDRQKKKLTEFYEKFANKGDGLKELKQCKTFFKINVTGVKIKLDSPEVFLKDCEKSLKELNKFNELMNFLAKHLKGQEICLKLKKKYKQ